MHILSVGADMKSFEHHASHSTHHPRLDNPLLSLYTGKVLARSATCRMSKAEAKKQALTLGNQNKDSLHYKNRKLLLCTLK
jgi:hypothetical protein